eukprot:9078798-Pyramimonas_sp.AAC.1
MPRALPELMRRKAARAWSGVIGSSLSSAARRRVSLSASTRSASSCVGSFHTRSQNRVFCSRMVSGWAMDLAATSPS